MIDQSEILTQPSKKAMILPKGVPQILTEHSRNPSDATKADNEKTIRRGELKILRGRKPDIVQIRPGVSKHGKNLVVDIPPEDIT